MLGDLLEEYALRAESGSPLAARSWFWSQACRSVLPMLWSTLRSENWLRSTGVAMGVYVAMGMLKFAADFLLVKFADPGPTTRIVLAPIVFLTAAAIGGYITARIRREATACLAMMVMITVAALMAAKVCSIPVPWWYPVGFLTLGPLAVLLTPALFRSLRPATVTRST